MQLIKQLTPSSLILAGAIFATPIIAATDQPVDSQDTIATDIADSAKPLIEDPGLQIEAMIEEYEYNGIGKRFIERASRGELYYTTATATVMAAPENRDWANFRVMAYKEALLKAQAKYVESLGITVRSESIQKLFDDKTKMPQFTAEELRSSDKMLELLNKAEAYAGGMLDQKLEEVGIDPTEYNAAPPEKRALLFEKSVAEKTISNARQSITGVIPVKTFEAYDAQGNHVVAVAIVASARFRQFVDDVIRSKGDIAPDPEKASSITIMEQLRGNKQALIDEFGIRRLYDEQGYPVLVSFGQSSNPYRGSDYQARADNRDLSYAAAKSQAYANFAYLFKSTAESKEETSQQAARKTIGKATKEPNGVTNSEESTLDFVKTIDREITAKGKVSNLPGTRELFRWTEKHPINNHEINGVVYIWSPQLEQTARNLKNFKPKQETVSRQSTRATYSSGSSTSADRMSADDF